MPTILPPSRSIDTSDLGWEIADSPLIRRRAFFCLIGLALAFSALLARLYFLQVRERLQFRGAGAKQPVCARSPCPRRAD